jgi:hypothetical protein
MSGADQLAARDLIASTAEGFRQWSERLDSTRLGAVAAAWWTDPLDRKHVRVGAWEGLAEQAALKRGIFTPLADRPPAWLVHPDDLYVDADTGALLAACRCGAAGALDAIAWTGDVCGPCHDRRESGEPRPGADFPRRTVFPGPPGAVLGLSFGPDGRRLLVRASFGKPLRILDLATGEDRDHINLTPADVLDALLSPDGETVAVATDRGPVLLVDGEGNVSRRLTTDHGRAAAVAFTPDGGTLAAAYGDRILFWSVADGAVLDDLATPVGATPGAWLLFADGGRVLVAGAPDVSPLPFDTETRTLREVSAVRLGPAGPAASADGRVVALPLHGGVSLRTGALGKERCRVTAAHEAVAVSPDGGLAATVGIDGAVRMWATDDGRDLGAWEWDRCPLYAAAFAPDGRWLATGASDGTVKLWPVADLLREGT